MTSGAEFADAGDGAHDLDRGSKGLDLAVDLLIDLCDGCVDRVNMLEEKAQHEAMMVGHSAAQRCLQFGWAGFDPAVGQGSQSSRVGFAGDQRFDHPTTGQADDVGNHRVEFDVGVFQRLLDALDVTAPLPHELLAGSQQVAHLLRRLVGNETRSDQPVRQQVGQPGGIVDVGFAAGHILDVCRVRQHRLSRLAISLNFRKHQLVVLQDHPGAGRDLSQP